MELEFAILCDYAMVSQEGKLSVLGIFDRVQPVGLPALVPVMFVVSSWRAVAVERGANKHLAIALESPTGAELMKAEAVIEVPRVFDPPDAAPRLNHVLGLAGVEFRSAGRHRFRIMLEGSEKVGLPLDVVPMPQTM